MNILIVGCGDTGSQLANVLDHMGNQVSVVDRNPETAAELSDSLRWEFPLTRMCCVMPVSKAVML